MADIIKRNREEWLIYHYNIWLRTLTAKEINLEYILSQKLNTEDIGAFTKATSILRASIEEAERYLKVIDELLNKLKK